MSLPSTESIPLNDNNDVNYPRKLTNDEIDDILSVVPEIKAPSVMVSQFNTKSMKEILKEQLSEIIITPLAIEDVKNEIVRQFNKSIVKPGTMVGVTAAESMGQPVTQMALNSFHQSGSSKNVTYGVDSFRELINASMNIKNPSCSIFFEDQTLSFDDIIRKVRPALTQINISDIVKDIPEIESTDPSKFEEPDWYEGYRLFVRNDFSSKYVLRLKLDVNMLYAYKITMEEIASVIEDDGSIICVYSPLDEGVLHLYPVERAIAGKVKSSSSMSKEDATMRFLWEAVAPGLNKIQISGVLGINKIYPITAPVLQIIKEEINLSHGRWQVILNPVRMRITGIKPDKIIRLFHLAGIKIISQDLPHSLVVETANNDSPSVLTKNMIDKDSEDEKQYEEDRKKRNERIIRRPPTDVSISSNIVYADSDGSLFKGNYSTLRKLLGTQGIDNTRTYCNNVHEIKRTLGIEAARTYLIKAFTDVITNQGSYINPRHIVLLVDYMVSLGDVNGITSSGISRQPIGPLEKASIEKAMDAFKASGFGETTSVTGTSASIYVGKRAEIGTGYSDLYIPPEDVKRFEEEFKSRATMQIDVDEFKDAIDNMDEFVSGIDMLVMKGAEEEMFYTAAEEMGQEFEMFSPSTIMTEARTTPNIIPVKGKLVRSDALEQVADTISHAPCLRQPRKTEIKVEDISSSLDTLDLPIMTGSNIISEPSVISSMEPVVPGPMGIPDVLRQQMQDFIISDPPSQPDLPQSSLPPLDFPQETIEIVSESQTEIVDEPTEKKGPIMFNLDDFLK